MWVAATRIGLLGGAVAVYLSLVGMISALNKTQVIQLPAGSLTLGVILFVSVLFLSGWVACGRSRLPAGPRRVGIGAWAGLMGALVLAGLVLVGSQVNLRAVFVNASPELYHILTFTPATVSPLAGIPLLLLCGVVAGAVAGAAGLLPARWQRSLAVGVATVLVVGVMADQVRVILSYNKVPRSATGWLLAGKGLQALGAVVLFVVGWAVAWGWQREGPVVRARFQRQAPDRRQLARNGLLLLTVALLLALPRVLGTYPSQVLDTVGLFVLMGLGLNIVVGFAGMLDLGYVAFFAIGAYSIAILTSPESFLAVDGVAPFTFWTALPWAFLAALLSGVLLGIPVLPLRGDYLAIVTLGFGEIIKILALSDWLKPYLGGAQGIAGIPPISIPPMPILGFDGLVVAGPNKPQMMFYFILAACMLVAFVSLRLKDSRQGRAWMAVREDEDVARAMGIRLVRTKLMAFAIGAGFASLAGALFAAHLGSIYPHSFNLLISINVLSLIIVGGMGNIAGVILGALVLVGLPELLREFDEYRMLVYGALLVVMMLRRPAGLLPDAVHRRELAAGSSANGEPEATPVPGTAT